MEITDVEICKASGGGTILAYAVVTFDDCFVVHNVRIINGKKGIFIAMPSRRVGPGEYEDVAHPITQEFRVKMQERVLEEYRAAADAAAAEQTDLSRGTGESG